GESLPVEVTAGAAVLAGSVNTDGLLEIVVTQVGGATTLGKIIALMRTAERAKPPVSRLLDAFAGPYLALVLAIAAGTWFASGDMAATLAVLVASCPCALVLAAPATAVAAIAVAARHGILIKSAAFLERLAEVACVLFDKTGTLTEGELTVLRVVATPGARAGEGEWEVARLAASLGAASHHPVSRAAARGWQPSALLPVAAVREIGGFGVTGLLDGEEVALGRASPADMLSNGMPSPHDGPAAAVRRDGRVLGWLLLGDRVRPEAGAALADLRALGLSRQAIVTGDRDAVAASVAAQLGIADVTAAAMPEAKLRRVLAEVAAGRLPMVVGDGINDSLALRAGAVGVAMGARGTDVALASADLVLMSSDLRRLGTAIRLSRRCRRTIGVNVAIGLVWTAALVGLAATGALGAQGAIVAALLHNLSTFVGLGNAGRLMLFDETAGTVVSSAAMS
ncbi:MAG: cadmium-translocating P-type ATPase, partial [Acetobacteraceae bacterium]|nr:cadmium-translocating P-type ATPase [Acetobacteraceae bacterium]